MRCLFALCLVLSIVGLSQQLAPLQYGLGKILGGFIGGLTKHQSSEIVSSSFKRDQKSSDEQSCHRVPVKQCKDVSETVYERVEDTRCEQRPVEECHEEEVTEYTEEAREECEEVTEEECEQVQDRQCHNVKKPVQVRQEEASSRFS